MAHEITVPRLGWTMEEGTFGGWLKADGDSVREGDELFVLESDKASEAVTALDAGILRIPADGPRQGDVVKVGQRLAHLVAPGEAVPSAAVTAPSAAVERETTTTVSDPTERKLSSRGRRAISPRARRAARALGIDWARLTGSGRTGRIVERDVRGAVGRTAAAERVLPLSPIRRLIAERMAASSHTTAPVTLTTKADATRLREFRERRKAEGGSVPGYTELILSVTAKALGRHPLLNARWQEDAVVLCGGIHVGVAVDTPAGLVVPVIRDADRFDLDQLATRIQDLAERARSRRLRAEEMEGGTFTLTNLGAYGIDAFTPIINLPECAVLGVGRVVAEPAVHEGKIVPRDLVTLSLTFDHRVVDGAPAARFLNDVRLLIEAADGLGRPQ
ncbi:MAG TPA: dihydrolipoamide acetyltransferase family protein [Gemmataceae bacterium]|nr:dihydrolipoamide acetyltransferase family protein [Gemmataceae bacterium]